MARIKAAPSGPATDGSSVFHCISRTVGGQRLLTDLFTESVFVLYRERFGAKRRNGARPIRHAPALKDLSCLRDLRVRALG